jgi:predicted nuclease of predicted toxin-antitoxin system
MKILIDMNLSPDRVSRFARSEIEAVHWSKLGSPQAKDYEIMEYAQSNGFIVFTHDLDFGAILAATNADSPSVVQMRTQETFPNIVGDIVIAAIAQFRQELEIGALISIDIQRSRVRILPIGKNNIL